MKPALFPRGMPIIKRLFDLLLTIPGLLVISPFLLIIALILLIAEGSPVIFSQERPGYKGQLFKLYKFRSMRNQFDAQGNLLPDSGRISKTGRFLRSFSLDELPETYNVLRGEMSLVGPRPLLIKYLPLYNQEQTRRHDVFPGMTGWAQINGRNAASWQDRFRMDVWYVDHWSLWLDIKILFLTFWKVLKRESVSQPGQATVEEFKGNTE